GPETYQLRPVRRVKPIRPKAPLRLTLAEALSPGSRSKFAFPLDSAALPTLHQIWPTTPASRKTSPRHVCRRKPAPSSSSPSGTTKLLGLLAKNPAPAVGAPIVADCLEFPNRTAPLPLK